MRKDKEYLPKLLEYIELANKIPSDVEFPEYTDVYKLTMNRLGKNEKYCSANELIKTYQELLKDLPSDLFSYIFDSRESDTHRSVFDRIDLVISLNHGIGSIAYAVTEEQFGKEKENLNEIIRSIEDALPHYIPVLPIMISVNEEGFIEANSNEFFDFIKTYNIEARRIRNCVICSKIFWANRIDKWACSKSCGNTLRQRIWQFGNKADYNEKRRINYAYKKSMKNKRREN